jgi:hypothetical protein
MRVGGRNFGYFLAVWPGGESFTGQAGRMVCCDAKTKKEFEVHRLGGVAGYCYTKALRPTPGALWLLEADEPLAILCTPHLPSS